MSDILRGKLGYKGESGDSAYEIAVKNGFSGTEKEWLATLGTTNHFEQTKTTYTTTTTNVTTISIPTSYIDGSSFLDVFVNGQRLTALEYTLNLTNKTIELEKPLNSIGTVVEMVMITISTNELPIVETIDSTYDNNTTPGTKAVHDYVKTAIASKIDADSLNIITGTIPVMEVNSTMNVTVEYPNGMDKSNTVILSKNVLRDGTLIDSDNRETALSPVITGTKMTTEGIVLEISLGSTPIDTPSNYKLVLMKVGE